MSSTQNAVKTAQHMVNPVASPLWKQLIAGGGSNLFHSPRWMRVLEETYGLSFSAAVLEREGCPVAGVPWCDQDGLLGRRRMTLPFSDFCDPLAAGPEDASRLAEIALKDGIPWTLRSRASNLPRLETPVTHRTPFKWQGIDLSGDAQGIWNRVNSMGQRGLLKARRSGVKARKAKDKNDLREWYLLHLRLRKLKHRLLAQPFGFFEHIWDNFIEKGEGFLLLAGYQDRIIGGTLYLIWQDTCYYKFNASDSNYLNLRPNNLLLWEGIVEAREKGCSLLDLGRSPTSQEGLISFKRNFGTLEEDLFSVTYGLEDQDPHASAEARQLLQRLTQFFTRESVPDDLSEEAAALLYQYFA